jgi:hypothetical protein
LSLDFKAWAISAHANLSEIGKPLDNASYHSAHQRSRTAAVRGSQFVRELVVEQGATAARVLPNSLLRPAGGSFRWLTWLNCLDLRQTLREWSRANRPCPRALRQLASTSSRISPLFKLHRERTFKSRRGLIAGKERGALRNARAKGKRLGGMLNYYYRQAA